MLNMELMSVKVRVTQQQQEDEGGSEGSKVAGASVVCK